MVFHMFKVSVSGLLVLVVDSVNNASENEFKHLRYPDVVETVH